MLQKIIERILIPFIVLLMVFGCQNQKGEVKDDATTTKHVYDSVLAQKLEADDYGMSKYVIAFLKRGPNQSLDSAKRVSLQMEHLKNIGRLAEEGSLVLAGPLLDNGDLRGIYIFAVESVEEAKELTATDPAIQAGTLEMELHPWYGSAAVKEINDIHKKIQKVGVVE